MDSAFSMIFSRLHGSYEAIEGGQAMDALVDLTGGLAERYDIKTADLTMFKHMKQAHAAGSFIACSKKVRMKHRCEHISV